MNPRLNPLPRLIGVVTLVLALDAAAFVTENRVSAISAHLYYQETGTIDARDLTEGTGALWNTIIGEGSARAPSGAILVLVELSIDPKNLPESLAFKAVAAGRTLADQTVALKGFFTERTGLVIPFLVYGTGCEPLVLTASFAGKGSKKESLTRTVPFNCGE